MAHKLKLRNLIRMFLRPLPDVQCDNRWITLRKKVIYTAISALVFFVGSQIPLYGIQPTATRGPAPDNSLTWARLVLASKLDTLMTFGIAPILVPEITVQLLGIITMDNAAPEAWVFSNKERKLLGILSTIMQAYAYVLCKADTGNAALVFLQIFFSGIVVIYLDDYLKKGYGLLPGIPLFTAANFCGIVLWKALSPCTFTYGEQGAEFEGAVTALIHLLVTRTEKLSAIQEAFYRQNLPNVIDLVATCLFFPIAIFFHGISVVLPVWALSRRFQVNYHIKLSHISYAPIILHRPLLLLLSAISKVLFAKYGENKFINLPTPPTLVELLRDPVHASIYIASVLLTCVVASDIWFKACATSEGFYTRLWRKILRQEREPSQPDAMPIDTFHGYLYKTARFGGLCVGALIICGDLIGVIGSGTGAMLVVSAAYPYLEGNAGEIGVFGFGL